MSEARFLKEYEALIRKHRMYITACGCCDGEFLKRFESRYWQKLYGDFVDDTSGELQVQETLSRLREQ